MKLDVIAVGAHPDDIELSCGGTIIKLVKQGYKVGLVDLTEGELGTRGTRELRAREAQKATKLLGVAVRENLGLPDGNIEPTFDNRLKLMRLIRKHRPDIMLIPYHLDRHPDHEHAHQLCKEAWFYSGLVRIETEVGGHGQEPYRPRDYYCYMQWHEFMPSFIIDVTAEYERRMECMRAFRSQFYDPENRERETVLSTPQFLEMIKTRLEYYGQKIGTRYGEAFFSPRPLEVKDLLSLGIRNPA